MATTKKKTDKVARELAKATLRIRKLDKDLSERLVRVLGDELERYRRGE